MGETIEAIGGSYTLIKEVRLPFEVGDVLYTIGAALFDTTCCGVGGCGYARVLGFVRRWHVGEDDEGWPITEVEPITDPELQSRLKKLIMGREHVTQVNFS